MQGSKMCIRPQGVSRLYHGTSIIQHIWDVLADELCEGFFPDGVIHYICFVVLDVLQEGHAVLHAHTFCLQNHQVYQEVFQLHSRFGCFRKIK